MKKNTNSTALLWDESYLWAIWLYDALKKSNIHFEIIRADALEKLDKYKILFVPGGWAKNKLQAIGIERIQLIKEFIKNGGIYFGICGGAGLATEEGIGIVNIKRKKDRVPGFSGPVKVSLKEHLLWNGIKEPVFYLWWPSEFLIDDENIKVLASFDVPARGSFSSDIPVFDFETLWDEIESVYGINLNPEKMKGAPLLIEAEYGKGKVFLSLIHFDTPNDKKGLKFLKNLKNIFQLADSESENSLNSRQAEILPVARNLLNKIKAFMEFGERNFLWFKRYPFIYQWRRGIRGFEYVNLYYMIERISSETKTMNDLIHKRLLELSPKLEKFLSDAKELLLRERIALQRGKITYNICDDPRINALREKLFGENKSYGGFYKRLVEEVDDILFMLLKSHKKE